jgi:2-keto-3-deoxy-L-rhamnonate aldolase RhmA
MKAARQLRERIKQETPTLGAIVSFHLWIGIVEIARSTGLDYLIVDTEHHRFDHELIADVCALGRMVDYPILIRPPSIDPTTIRLAMDAGPCGLLLPMVDDVSILETVKEGAFMPPRGKRRPGGPGNRWVGNYDYATWKAEVEDELIILPQIESPTGLDNAEAIASHPLTTALAVGPYDLSAHLGVCWQPEAPSLLHALERIRVAARAVGKTMWMIGDGPALRKRGFSFVCIAEPIMLLESSLKDLVQRTRSSQTAGLGGAAMPLP